jgi:hypothetical protein
MSPNFNVRDEERPVGVFLSYLSIGGVVEAALLLSKVVAAVQTLGTELLRFVN